MPHLSLTLSYNHVLPRDLEYGHSVRYGMPPRLAAAAAAAVVADTAAASDKAPVYHAVAVYCVDFFAVQHPTSFASSHVCRVLICKCRAEYGMRSSGGTFGLGAPGADAFASRNI